MKIRLYCEHLDELKEMGHEATMRRLTGDGAWQAAGGDGAARGGESGGGGGGGGGEENEEDEEDAPLAKRRKPAAAAAARAGTFSEGQRVEMLCGPRGRWEPASIADVNEDGTYDVALAAGAADAGICCI